MMLLVRKTGRLRKLFGGIIPLTKAKSSLNANGMLTIICPALARWRSRCFAVGMAVQSSSSSCTRPSANFALPCLPITTAKTMPIAMALLSPSTPTSNFRVKFSTSSQMSRRRNSFDGEDLEEQAVETETGNHFANPNRISKYIDMNTDENSSKSLEEMAREHKKKLRLIEKGRAARYLGEDGESSKRRTLSWDTIDQIRFLRQENPSEWSVSMLAESFNVSQEVIVKVLKSKFTPGSRAKEKQDQAVAENTGYQPRRVGGEIIEEAAQLNPGSQREGEKPKQSNIRYNENIAKTPQHQHKIAKSHRHEDRTPTKISAVKEKTTCNTDDAEKSMCDTDDTEAEFTFGRFDFENIDSLMGQFELKPQVIRKGRNFYNENGEFLYRI